MLTILTDRDAPAARLFRAAIKVVPTLVVQMRKPFLVVTPHGAVEGGAGDYLARDSEGAYYPMKESVYRSSYGRGIGALAQVISASADAGTAALVVRSDEGPKFVRGTFSIDGEEYVVQIAQVGYNACRG